MKTFLTRFGSEITATLSGFDRLVFRGHLIALIRPGGMYAFLKRVNVRLLDFKEYVSSISEQIKRLALSPEQNFGRPRTYLPSSSVDKEALVQKILREHPTESGLVCTLTAVEPCMSFQYQKSADRNERGLRLCPRKCLHIYKYFIDPVFGLIGTRLQTWFPFAIQIWLNGHEWLAVQLRSSNIDFRRNDNAITWVADPHAAQRLFDEQLTTDWTSALTTIRRTIHPLHDSIFVDSPLDYYWSGYQTEWATDLLFRDPAALAKIYPALYRHAMLHFHSTDVMRFLGRRITGKYTGDVTTRFKDRPEGVRIKHWVHGNSIKMYDKAGNVLRVETTIANPSDFRAFRPKQNDPNGPLSWNPLRKSVADLHRRAQVSQAANARYLDALSTVEDSTPLSVLFDPVSRPIVRNGRRIRALRIGDSHDLALLQAISDGRFTTSGFRNRDLRQMLFPAQSTCSAKRQAAKVTRLLRILRAHRLIRKVQRSNRYLLTSKGTHLTAALFATRNATTKQLLQAA